MIIHSVIGTILFIASCISMFYLVQFYIAGNFPIIGTLVVIGLLAFTFYFFNPFKISYNIVTDK